MINISKKQIVNILLIYIFIGTVFVDLYNGYTQLMMGSETILQNVYKGCVILLAAPCFFISTKYVKLLFSLLFLAVASVVYWDLGSYLLDVKFDIIGLVKVLYGYFVLLFLLGNKKYIEKEQLIKYVILYGVIAAASLFITAYLGIARYKYGESFSFGIQGLFVAGNDLGLTLLMCNCLACYMFLKTSSVYYAVANIMITVAGVLIGSVAGLFGSSFIIGCLLFNGLFLKKGRRILKKWQKLYFGLIIIVAIPVLYTAVQYITTIDSYNENKFSTNRLTSGGAREGLRETAADIISTYNAADLLFGRGSAYTYYDMGKRMRLPTRAIELDQYELFASYGLLLGGMLLLLPILLGIRTFLRFLKYRKNLDFWATLAMTFFLGHAFTAGHAYGNVTAMQIVAVLAYCYYIKSPNDQTHGILNK